MKKTFPVNINGSVFYIDEDAYQLLNTYLEQLRAAFKGEEGLEIVADIEARIAEIFSERVAAGSAVVVIEDVNNVIEQMGRPSDMGATEQVDEEPAANQVPPPFPRPRAIKKRLFRDENNRVFGGVLSGLAQYAGWTTNVLRLLVAVLWFLLLFTAWQYSWSLIIVYLLAWMIIPPARTAQQYLEMTGTPVTIGNVGQTILGTSASSAKVESGNFLKTFFSVIGKIILIVFGIGAGAFCLMALFVLSVAVLSFSTHWHYLLGADGIGLLNGVNPVFGGFGLITLSLAVILLGIAVIWCASCVLFRTKGASKALIISAFVTEIILVVLTAVFFTIATEHPSDFALTVHDIFAPFASGILTALPLQFC